MSQSQEDKGVFAAADAAAVEAAMADAEEISKMLRPDGMATIGRMELWSPTCGLRVVRGRFKFTLQQLWKDCYSSATEWRDVEVINEP